MRALIASLALLTGCGSLLCPGDTVAYEEACYTVDVTCPLWHYRDEAGECVDVRAWAVDPTGRRLPEPAFRMWYAELGCLKDDQCARGTDTPAAENAACIQERYDAEREFQPLCRYEAFEAATCLKEALEATCVDGAWTEPVACTRAYYDCSG